MSRPRDPEKARAKAQRQREAKQRGGYVPPRGASATENNQHGTNPGAVRAQRDGERKALREREAGRI